MTRKRRTNSPAREDIALFHEAIGPVRRITVDSAISKPRPKPVARSRQQDEADALDQLRTDPFAFAEGSIGDTLSFRRDHLPMRVFKRLKRGEFSVTDEIDLHRLNAAQAETTLRTFLNEASHEDHHCVRIIHGKGLRSEGTPVLKALVDRMLRQRSDVLAFCAAPANQGGSGATVVLLSNR